MSLLQTGITLHCDTCFKKPFFKVPGTAEINIHLGSRIKCYLYVYFTQININAGII